MVATDRLLEILADAQKHHNSSLAHLDSGKIRDASENAWRATKLATDALILARWSFEPTLDSETTTELHKLAVADQRVELLIDRYHINHEYLHHSCARLGLCDPVESAEQYIRETADYIRDAEELANVQA